MAGRVLGGSKFNVKVQTYNEAIIELEVERSMLIKDTKAKIFEKTNCLGKTFNLYFAGVKLDDAKKIEEYKIDKDDVLVQSKDDLTA